MKKSVTAMRMERGDITTKLKKGDSMKKIIYLGCAVLVLSACKSSSKQETTAAPAAAQTTTTTQETAMTKTSSGLQYQDLVPGTGAAPVQGKPVTVNYTGWLTDGTKFDSSLDHGQPFQFTLGVGQVIKGWDEGVSTMKVGGKRKLVIPAELAYGSRGAGGVIPPDATLVFEVELLGAQ